MVGWKTVIDMRGKVVGRLTVLEYDYTNKNGFAVWLCICSCGRQCSVVGAKLRRPIALRTQSCGCIRNEKGAERFRLWHQKKKEGERQMFGKSEVKKRTSAEILTEMQAAMMKAIDELGGRRDISLEAVQTSAVSTVPSIAMLVVQSVAQRRLRADAAVQGSADSLASGPSNIVKEVTAVSKAKRFLFGENDPMLRR